MKFIFWITSSRGTDHSEIVNVPKKIANNRKEFDFKKEDWASQFGAYHHGDNYVRYGSFLIDPFLKKTKDDLEKMTKRLSRKIKRLSAEQENIDIQLESLQQQLKLLVRQKNQNLIEHDNIERSIKLLFPEKKRSKKNGRANPKS